MIASENLTAQNLDRYELYKESTQLLIRKAELIKEQ
jgi:hypothetical protein